MARLQKQLQCKDCEKKTLHTKEVFSGGMGCLLTVITAGLFLPIWIVIGIIEAFRRWYCQSCGRPRR